MLQEKFRPPSFLGGQSVTLSVIISHQIETRPRRPPEPPSRTPQGGRDQKAKPRSLSWKARSGRGGSRSLTMPAVSSCKKERAARCNARPSSWWWCWCCSCGVAKPT